MMPKEDDVLDSAVPVALVEHSENARTALVSHSDEMKVVRHV